MGNDWHDGFSTDEYMYGKEANAFVQAVAERLSQCSEHFFVGEVHREEGVMHTGDSHVVQSLVKKRGRADK